MKKAVVALILHPKFPEERLILGVSRRYDHNDMGLPGGKVEDGETEDEAIVREIYEETGLTFTEPSVIYGETRTKDGRSTAVYTFVGKVTGEIRSSDEGVARWATPEELANGSFGEYNRNLFKKRGIELNDSKDSDT